MYTKLPEDEYRRIKKKVEKMQVSYRDLGYIEFNWKNLTPKKRQRAIFVYKTEVLRDLISRRLSELNRQSIDHSRFAKYKR